MMVRLLLGSDMYFWWPYQIEEPLRFGSPVAHRVGAGAARPHHPTYGRAWPWVEGEEQRDLLLGEVGVEVFPLDARLQRDIPVCLGHAEDLVHKRHVQRYPTVRLHPKTPYQLNTFWRDEATRLTLLKCPSKLVPPENGVMGTLYFLATITISCTSFVLSTQTTTVGRFSSW